MKYEIKKFGKCLYQGYHIKVELNNISRIDFKSIWNKVFNETKHVVKESDEYFIGYEDYSKLTKSNKTFDYYALAPAHFFSLKSKDHCYVTLEEGSYILFGNTLKTHGPQFFRKVYNYIDKQGIIIDRSCDFEIIPLNFNYDNQESSIYVGLRLVEEK